MIGNIRRYISATAFFLIGCPFVLPGANKHYPQEISRNLALAKHYLYINEDSSLIFSDKVYTWAVRNKERELECEILLLKAENLLYKGEIEKVLEICRTVHETAQNTGNRSLLISVLILQGRCYTEMNIYDRAYSEIASAYEIASQIKDSVLIATSLNAFGVLYDLQRDSKRALSYYEQGLRYADENSDALLKIRLLNNKAIVYTGDGKLDEAQKILSYCIDYVSRHGIAFGLDRLYMNLAPIYITKGHTDSALQSIRQSLDIARQHENRSSIARSLIYMGYILFTINDIENAKTAFLTADSIALSLNSDNMHCMLLQYFAWIAETEKDYESAYRYMQMFKSASDSLAIKQNVVNMVRLRMENEAAQAELEGKYRLYRLILITVLMASVLILAGAVFFFWYKRSRRLLASKQVENTVLAAELEQENKKMVTQSIYRQKQVNDLQQLAEQLQRSRNLFKISNQPLIDRTIALLKDHSEEEKWEDFETRFERVHTDFLKNLQKKYPNLSPAEKRLCAYLRLNMTTKEIANILHVSSRAVEQSRYRLRKKLGLDKKEDLVNFLCQFDTHP